MKREDLVALAKGWGVVRGLLGRFGASFDSTNAAKIAEAIDLLLDATSNDSTLPELVDLLNFLSEWTQEFEAATVQIPDLSPVELLKHLMEQNGLKQRDLSEALGGQSVVSQIINGRRQINARQARALSARFGVSAAAFIEGGGLRDATPSRVGDTAETLVVSFSGGTEYKGMTYGERTFCH